MLASKVEFDPATSGAVHRILSSSNKRVTLTLFAPRTGMVTLSNEPTPTQDQGIDLIPGQNPVHLDVRLHGDCVQREWYAFYTGTFSPIAWIQSLATCDLDQDRYLGNIKGR